MKKGFLILVLLLAADMVMAQANEVYISNARDWNDVYSIMQFGYIKEVSPAFLVSERHSSLILNDYDSDDVSVKIYTSGSPYVVGMKSIAESRGFETEEIETSNINLELAEDVGTRKFILIDDAYGYNAMSVAPFASVAKYFVLFADRENIDDVMDFLEEFPPEDIIVYGTVDREVRDAVAIFDPEIINKNGDRYANNVEIIKKYLEVKPVQQVLLNNGEFIEAQLMSGSEPIVFIGRGSVPDVVREFIQDSDIKVGVLIGNELIGTASSVRRQLGISVFVKYARSARAPSGIVNQVEGLDRFFLPVYELNLEIQEIRYNTVSNQVEITLRNNAEIATYFRGSYTLTAGDQQETFGDSDPLFMDAGSTKTLVYDVDPVIDTSKITVTAFILYGESEDSLERTLEGEYQVEVVDILDSAEVVIREVEFDLSKQSFIVHLENVGQVTSFVDTEAVEVQILDEIVDFGAEEVIELKPGKIGKSFIPTTLIEEDLEDNPKVRIRAYYGENEDALSKIIEGEFEYKIRKFNLLANAPLVIIIILILLILAAVTKKKCPSCRKKTSRFAKFCKKCGYKLK